jgi:hypothetical protein
MLRIISTATKAHSDNSNSLLYRKNTKNPLLTCKTEDNTILKNPNSNPKTVETLDFATLCVSVVVISIMSFIYNDTIH